MNIRDYVLWNGSEWVPNVIAQPHWSRLRIWAAKRRAIYIAAYLNWKKARP